MAAVARVAMMSALEVRSMSLEEFGGIWKGLLLPNVETTTDSFKQGSRIYCERVRLSDLWSVMIIQGTFDIAAE
jgi:hypothetical protein